MGWIRRPAVSPRPWLGDVARGVWYRAPELPAWINGRARSKLITYLAFAEVSLLLLGVCYALMSLAS